MIEARFDWNDTNVESLKTLWTDGLSCSQIARAMGGGLTRNAVIGKVTRLGLPLRGKGGTGLGSVRPAPRPRAIAEKGVRALLRATEQIPDPDPFRFEDGGFVTVLTVSDRMCRWPVGDPAAEEFHFCGNNPVAGAPYCEAHCRKAYQPRGAQSAA